MKATRQHEVQIFADGEIIFNEGDSSSEIVPSRSHR